MSCAASARVLQGREFRKELLRSWARLLHAIHTTRSCLPAALPAILSFRMKISRLVLFLARCALLGAAVLVIANQFVSSNLHPYLGSFPLALAGIGYSLLQIHLRPPRQTLWKRLALPAAFLLWAIVQFLPPGRLNVFLGDAVIAAYVVDLLWMMQDQM